MSKSERFGALDGWRGLLALAIALYHFECNGWLRNSALIAHGFVRADFFFVISGFVITHVYEKRLEKGGGDDFLLRRIARIWPLHVATLLAFIGLELIQLLATGEGFQDDRGISRIPMNLFLLHGLGFETALTWNFPTWALSVEVALYLSFVGFVFLPRRARPPVAVAIVVLCLTTLALVNRHGLVSTFEFGPLRGAVGFYTGYLVYHLRQRYRVRVGSLAEVLCVAMILGYMMYFVTDGARTFVATPIFAISTYVFAQGAGVVSRVLKSPIFATLGKWSYSIYMLHALFFVSLRGLVKLVPTPWFHIDAGDRIIGPPVVIDLVTLAYLIAVCATASVTYRLIEMPGQTLILNLAAKLRRTRIAPAPGAPPQADGRRSHR